MQIYKNSPTFTSRGADFKPLKLCIVSLRCKYNKSQRLSQASGINTILTPYGLKPKTNIGNFFHSSKTKRKELTIKVPPPSSFSGSGLGFLLQKHRFSVYIAALYSFVCCTDLRYLRHSSYGVFISGL